MVPKIVPFSTEMIRKTFSVVECFALSLTYRLRTPDNDMSTVILVVPLFLKESIRLNATVVAIYRMSLVSVYIYIYVW